MTVTTPVRRLACAWITCALMAGNALATGLPAALLSSSPWQQLGHGEASWLGLSLYKAALWAPAANWAAHRRYALALEYARDFSSERLVATSVDEIERLFEPSAETLSRWQGELERALPDVVEGDIVVGVFEPGQGASFYLGESLISEGKDPELAAAFFAIWLDPRTRLPSLRERLLGGVGND